MRQAKADLKDKQGGAYDTDTSDVPKKRAHETIGEHQQAQDGADVRTMPRSKTNPQFNRETLPKALAGFRISYEHMADLGGLRGKIRNTPPAINGL